MYNNEPMQDLGLKVWGGGGVSGCYAVSGYSALYSTLKNTVSNCNWGVLQSTIS